VKVGVGGGGVAVAVEVGVGTKVCRAWAEDRKRKTPIRTAREKRTARMVWKGREA